MPIWGRRNGDRPINNGDVVHQAIPHLPYDIWMGKLENPAWLENASSNTFAMGVSIQQKLLSNDLIPYYASYMESPPNFAYGFCTADGCLRACPVKMLRAATTVRLKRAIANLKPVLSRKRNLLRAIYMYIYRILLGRKSRNMLQVGLHSFFRILVGRIERGGKLPIRRTIDRAPPPQRRPILLGNR